MTHRANSRNCTLTAWGNLPEDGTFLQTHLDGSPIIGHDSEENVIYAGDDTDDTYIPPTDIFMNDKSGLSIDYKEKVHELSHGGVFFDNETTVQLPLAIEEKEVAHNALADDIKKVLDIDYQPKLGWYSNVDSPTIVSLHKGLMSTGQDNMLYIQEDYLSSYGEFVFDSGSVIRYCKITNNAILHVLCTVDHYVSSNYIELILSRYYTCKAYQPPTDYIFFFPSAKIGTYVMTAAINKIRQWRPESEIGVMKFPVMAYFATNDLFFWGSVIHIFN